MSNIINYRKQKRPFPGLLTDVNFLRFETASQKENIAKYIRFETLILKSNTKIKRKATKMENICFKSTKGQYL